MLLTLCLGLIVGAIQALTGAGGGILAVPLLVFGLHLGVAQAGPIGLLAVGMSAALGAVLGLKQKIVRYRAAMVISFTGVLLSPVGMWLAHRVDGRALGVLFALVLLYVARRTFRQAVSKEPVPEQEFDPGLPCVRHAGTGRFIWTTRCAGALSLSGAVAGLLSGLLGVGGGFVMVPALRRFTDLDMQSTVATSLAVIALISLTGVLTSVAAGVMNWVVGMPFAAGALAGMLGGRIVSVKLAGPQLQIGFAVMSAAVAVGMMIKSLA